VVAHGSDPARDFHAAAGGKTRRLDKRAISPVANKKATALPADIFTAPAIASYLAGTTGDVTAAVYDAENGQTSLYRPGIEENTASIVKVDILATLLSQSQAQDVALTPLQQATAQGMIEESDDNDATDLWDTVGQAYGISHFNEQIPLTETAPNTEGYWGLTQTSASDQVQLLQKVAYPNSLLSDTSRAYMLSLMTNVDPSQSWGISAGIPPGVTVAIKNGWLPDDSGIWQVNSIGYVDGDGRNYLIAVLTNGYTTEGQGISTIEGLASRVWTELAPAK
jgi:hypothetical protein